VQNLNNLPGSQASRQQRHQMLMHLGQHDTGNTGGGKAPANVCVCVCAPCIHACARSMRHAMRAVHWGPTTASSSPHCHHTPTAPRHASTSQAACCITPTVTTCACHPTQSQRAPHSAPGTAARLGLAGRTGASRDHEQNQLLATELESTKWCAGRVRCWLFGGAGGCLLLTQSSAAKQQPECMCYCGARASNAHGVLHGLRAHVFLLRVEPGCVHAGRAAWACCRPRLQVRCSAYGLGAHGKGLWPCYCCFACFWGASITGRSLTTLNIPH
jgi:hypothetical protein